MAIPESVVQLWLCIWKQCDEISSFLESNFHHHAYHTIHSIMPMCTEKQQAADALLYKMNEYIQCWIKEGKLRKY